jgi:hypothetical protein
LRGPYDDPPERAPEGYAFERHDCERDSYTNRDFCSWTLVRVDRPWDGAPSECRRATDCGKGYECVRGKCLHP